MRAYREANPSQGTQILTDVDFANIAVADRSKDVLYIIAEGTGSDVTITSGNITINDVYVGNNRQNFLVGNSGAIACVGNVNNAATPLAPITGFTNAPVGLSELV